MGLTGVEPAWIRLWPVVLVDPWGYVHGFLLSIITSIFNSFLQLTR
ncbi:hypothetical protein DKAM_1300 [Desulfurococcus amylolyticus 1221n]|uniref:Uncharacterized protein n=1 Tax=Desulfurococcus amylolyticus (strain DSM 18924 / JCM 16383 / VKM B-2413 / 1221n) TaxID=490899 RepID=B8D695_DESA1|nr:hypothetical protein DKAM_1300 [Desulfurococcus amylolyticus 1221n]